MRTNIRRAVPTATNHTASRFSHNLPLPKPGIGAGPGRPNVYDNARFPQIAGALSRDYGFTAEQLGAVFGVSNRTINHWMQEHKDFKDAVKKGRDSYDSINVENALLKRAMGYQFTEVSTQRIRITVKDANGIKVKIPATKVITTNKEIPPDTKSAIFWLTNRNPERWRVHLNINTKVGGTVQHNHTGVVASAQLENLNKDQLLALRDMISQQHGQEAIELNAEQQKLDDEIIPEHLAGLLREIGYDDSDYADFTE